MDLVDDIISKRFFGGSNMKISDYDVIVIGGGHAGVEAAAASARRGIPTVLLTDSYDSLGMMSCNPAVGGLSKGQIALEVDALGGLIGRATERAGIQFKTLNKSKGPAVQAPRAQCDRQLYHRAIRNLLEEQANLTIKEDRVCELLTEAGSICGVETVSRIQYLARAVVVCAGTFLDGKIYIGLENYPGGRRGDPAANRLAESLRNKGLQTARLKTGTPPRIDGKSVNFEQLTRQEGEEPPPGFSFYSDDGPKNLRPCWLTSTNPRTHEIIRGGLDRSPLYGTEEIEGTGVRYCPSIEDKVLKFEERDSHTVFLEPEGLETTEFYANGIPTSLPPDVQLDFVHSIAGLEEARLTRWGYAIEYDFFQPTQLNTSLETRQVAGLFLAGQVNGTTGYEEAAGQGLMAGINAAGKILEKEPFILDRTEAYIGVLIDDLVTQGTTEPYRMFTSRAEHRLRLRCDNAHYRLTPRANELNLISESTWDKFQAEQNTRATYLEKFKSTRVKPNSAELKALNKALEEPLELTESRSIWALLKRPEIKLEAILEADLVTPPEPPRVGQHLAIEAKYEGYIKRQEDKVEKTRRMEARKIPADFSYQELAELSNESVEKLQAVRPDTLGQAGRISGIKPTDVQIIMAHLDSPDHQ